VSEALSQAPQPAFRLIPSRFPPIGLFDTVATAADLAQVMELAGWTNDRLVAERLARLPRDEWVFGRANASVVMAAFLHASPSGMRFSGPDLGAWYASARLATAIVEVAHHLRREAFASGVATLVRDYRTYDSRPAGLYLDITGGQAGLPDLYASASYAAGQAFGEAQRAAGRDGILFNSLRHEGGLNVVCYRPTKVEAVVQADHYRLTVHAADRSIVAEKLAA
jgi:hypothetical protein